MACETFVEKRFGAETRELIDQANGIVREYQDQNLRLTLRQLYYQFVSRDLFPDDRTWMQVEGTNKWVRVAPDDPRGSRNAESNYKWLGGILGDARLAGLTDWGAIEDRGRQPTIWDEFDGPREALQVALDRYRLPRRADQRNYVELWVEKEALAGVLRPLAAEAHVTLMVNKGYSSLSAMYESAQRFKILANIPESDDHDSERDSKEPHLFYLGDHDPSGEDMVRDIRDRLSLFGAEVTVQKVALTTAQVQQYNPPPNPVKLKDARAKAYIRAHGQRCWEVDALPPDVLARLIRVAINGVTDKRKMDAVKAREKAHKEKVQVFLDGLENDEP